MGHNLSSLGIESQGQVRVRVTIRVVSWEISLRKFPEIFCYFFIAVIGCDVNTDINDKKTAIM